jgi:hypothetical protein
MSVAVKPNGVSHPELMAAHRNLELVGDADKLPALESESLRLAQLIRNGAISKALSPGPTILTPKA